MQATNTHRFATSSSGLPAIVMYIENDTMTFFYNILISLAITIVVSFKRIEKAEASEYEGVKSEKIYSPANGNIVPISEVPSNQHRKL